MNKFLSYLKMAFGNLKAYAWINTKMCLSFACLAFLVCLFTVYNQSITAITEQTYAEAVSGNYFWSTSDRPQILEELGCEQYETYTYRVASLSNRMKRIYDDENAPSCTTRYLQLTYEGVTYTEIEDMPWYGVELVTDNPFNGHDYVSLDAAYGIDSPVIGKLIPESADEVVIRAAILKSYGIDPQDALGKQLTATIDGDSAPLFTATVCGIIIGEYYNLSGHSSAVICPNFILHSDNPIFKTETPTKRYVYLLNDWYNYEKEYLMDLFYNKTFRYGGLSTYNSLFVLKNIHRLANTLYYVIGSGLVVGMILTIYLMIDKYIRVYSRMSGIFLTLGMRRREVYRLLLMQIMLICIIAIPISIAMTAFSYTVITAIVYRATAIKMASSVAQISKMLGLGIGVVTLIAACFYLYIKSKLKKHTVKELLSSVVS